MTAIITSQFRINAAQFIKQDIGNSADYYMFLGRNQSWPNEDIDPDTAIDTTLIPPNEDIFKNTFYNAYSNMGILKQINNSDMELCSRRNIWETGKSYKPWSSYEDNTTLSTFSESDVADNVVYDRKVFVCLYAPIGSVVVDPITNDITSIVYAASTSSPLLPSGSDLTKVVESTDGYIWKFLYEIDSDLNTKFTTSKYIPTPIGSASGTTRDQDQLNVENSAVDGKIYSIVVTNGGLYTVGNKPTVHLYGDGSVDKGIEIPADQITMGVYTAGTADRIGKEYIESINILPENPTEVDLNSDATSIANNIGRWREANIVISYNSTALEEQASANAILPPPGGFGKSARAVLGSNNLGVNCQFDLTEYDEAPRMFHEIGIVSGVEGVTTNTAGIINPLPSLKITSMNALSSNATNTISMAVGVGNTETATAYIDHTTIEGDVTTVYYHQSDETGYISFDSGSSLMDSNDSSLGTVDSLHNPEIARFTGDVVYFEKRHRVNRVADQIENIKLVIEL